nr:MAG TPA: hypothetical protein [Caudoviricetes sp.]
MDHFFNVVDDLLWRQVVPFVSVIILNHNY